MTNPVLGPSGVYKSNYRVAVIGSGISGLTAAYQLRDYAHVTLYEANDYIGGHTNTIDISLEGIEFPVDTGFLVFNERTYPKLIALFKELDVETTLSDMSFAVSLPEIDLEWSGTSLNTVFAQRKNLFSLRFLRMLKDILKFNKQCTQMALTQSKSLKPQEAWESKELETPLSEFLQRHGYGKPFIHWYLLPMAAAIWSCPTTQMMRFPMATFVRFCHNHGLLQVENRPRWFTVKGGARHYVEKILPHIPQKILNSPVQNVSPTHHGQVIVHTTEHQQTYDAVIVAAHSDQTHAMLSENNPKLRSVLEHINYQDNIAYLHTDKTLMPKRPEVWSSWNYISDVNNPQPSVSVSYWLNRLQPLPFKTPVIVTLNPLKPPHPDKIIRTIYYTHPIFDQAAIDAQQSLNSAQGEAGIFVAGAWTGYGFHEDGHRSGLEAAERLQQYLSGKSAANKEPCA
jgi:predicted NAD/FAD-binding protein